MSDEKKKILWIEDDAKKDFKYLIPPIVISGKYEIITAGNASDGLNHLFADRYDAIIIDIRIPPGNNQSFVQLYNNLGGNTGTSKLGLRFLNSLFKGSKPYIEITNIPDWVKPQLF